MIYSKRGRKPIGVRAARAEEKVLDAEFTGDGDTRRGSDIIRPRKHARGGTDKKPMTYI